MYLMNALGSRDRVIQWIPVNMQVVLVKLADFMPEGYLKRVLTIISDLFVRFKNAKAESGDGWESLFVIVLLIRAVTGQFSALLPLSLELIGPYEVWCNLYKSSEILWEDVKTLEQLSKGMKTPPKLPAIVIYYPPNNKFEVYDVIVVAYSDDGRKDLYGYQLKEGKNKPRHPADPSCKKSFVIRGEAKTQPSSPAGLDLPP